MYPEVINSLIKKKEGFGSEMKSPQFNFYFFLVFGGLHQDTMLC
jgi:hypothetical protein